VAIPKIGQAKSVIIGLLCYMTGMILFGMATEGWMMFLILVVYCLGGIAGPALQGLISTQVHRSEQGELQGGLTSLMSVASIIGPLTMNSLFAWFTSDKAPLYFPGAPFIAGALLLLLSILLARPFLRTNKHQ